MIGIPEIGTKAWVRPAPGRRVQDGPRPVDAMGGGRWLTEAREVVWTPFHLEQLRAGDILLAAPPKATEAAVPPAVPPAPSPAPATEK
jgi:hypothetical protein